ncbi:hypothetical protein MtrunA17_Chr4g0044361 [Medicago truncatula]|uniref:Plastid movement impaired protein n=2 Tax=Medicago TaxID=3877 RepID=I3SYI8_MEDTR|nr:uncharacterized protein At1g66480 [Medicago truncatula]AFK45330.1 unknown [Medicago truncatula]AFP87383.1 unknown [Medicago sativa]KEH30890.1 plastid movement impaired protein [Medicago truncatula]RHN62153.1 hypothetical protein MtrunA17_Chr4g0044361 [Medicago truncatula]
MGNTFGSKKTTKVMKIDGETMKLKTPIKAGEVLKDHPGLVLLDSEAVKHYGVRAKVIEAHKELQPKRLYFLVELPKETKPRRIRSGIQMSAKDRLDNLVLTRRSASDLSILKQSKMNDNSGELEGKENGGGVRLKVRLPKAEVEKLMRDCKDEAEAAEMIMRLYKASGKGEKETIVKESPRTPRTPRTPRQKRVSFMPSNEGGIQIAVAS